MKSHRRHETFLEQLKKKVAELKDIKPGEVHVISVNANYGHYQLVIGPEKREGDGHTRHIEINGEIHHLFISPHTVRPHPSKNEVYENLRHTVIMQDLNVHFLDPKGDGEHLAISPSGDSGIQVREYINMAGERGKKMIKRALESKKLPTAAYHIVQKDILNALKEHKQKD